MGCFNVLTLEQSAEWDVLVRSFVDHDVYYLSGYVRSFFIHGDGIPLLLHYRNNQFEGINVLMKRDIALKPHFVSILEKDCFYDFITPYGYGGWLFAGNFNTDLLTNFSKEYVAFCLSKNVVCEFNRFHPLLNNADCMKNIFMVTNLGKTVSINIESKELIWERFTGKNRTWIRKSQKSGVKIFHSKDISLIEKFISIYNSTMDDDGADKYFYFQYAFYQSVFEDLKDNFEMFYALHNEQIIAMSIILFANRYMHYHLSGSLHEYRFLAPTNLLLYEAACWGSNRGFREFHLGGGVGSKDDNLLKFKEAFNKTSNNQFSVGKLIFDQEKYDYLVSLRESPGADGFDKKTSFFPLYRS